MLKTCSFFLFLLVIIPAPAFSQPKPTTDPQQKPRKVKKEPADAFKKWLQDVEPILSREELDAWKKLDNDAERERFIEDVWHRRDPDPDTEENEYREAYYERIAYVNEHFSSGVPGYKTDRGRIFLKYGKPDEIESHPAGGPYERTTSEGGGSTSVYPFERWWYRNLPGRSDVEIEFVDPTGTGEYRIARNPFEKMATIQMPGGSPTGIDQADYVRAAAGFGNPFSPREKDSAFNWMDISRLRDEAPSVNFDNLVNRTGQPVVEDTFITTAVHVSYFKQSDDRVVVAFTVLTDNRDLVFQDLGGIQTARVNISGRITSVAGRRAGFFEDAVTTTALPSELIEAKDRKSAYQKAVSLSPGRYRIDLLVRDVESGAASIQHLGFQVPKFGAQLSASSLVLASVLEQISDVPVSRQFVIGDKKVIPNLASTFRQGSPIGIYMQIYNSGIDQTTLRPAVDVEYALLKDGRELAKQIEDWRGVVTTGDRLTLARLIDSQKLAPGEYEVEVRVRDHVSAQFLTQKAKLTIIK